MLGRSLVRLTLLHLICCLGASSFATLPAAAPQVLAADSSGVARADPARQKEAFWERWRAAMANGEHSKAQSLVAGNRPLAESVANEVGGYAGKVLNKGEPSEALALFHAVILLFQQLNDELGIATTENNIGMAHLALQDCRSALPSFARASERYAMLDFKVGQAKATKGLAICVKALALPDSSVKGIANLKVFDKVQAIVFHPIRCKEVGEDVCEFYLMHEYAHIYLGHSSQTKPWEEGEKEADCWAAKYGRRSSAMAAYQWFLIAPPGISPRSHKSNELRAEAIRACGRF